MQDPLTLTRRGLLLGVAGGSAAAALAGCSTNGGGSPPPITPHAWHVSNFASKAQVAGYVDRPSLNRGEDLVLHVNCTGSNSGAPVKVAVHRTGWYGGAGAETMLHTVVLQAPAQQSAAEVADPTTKLCEADWAPFMTIPTRTGSAPWPSGFYVIQLTSASGKGAYVPFTLLPAEAAAVVVGAVLVCFFATLHPAWGAARLDPAEALRYE